MEYVASFFIAALTALSVENAVFSRGLGLDREFLFLKTPQMGILYGGVFTVMACASSIGASGISYLLQDTPYVDFLRAPVFLILVFIVYSLALYCVKRFLPQHYGILRRVLPVCTFNTAMFSVLFVIASRTYNLPRALGYALGTGLGFTASILIIYLARGRLAISPVPRSFRGLPILLVYIGLLSLALYGLIGQGLPG